MYFLCQNLELSRSKVHCSKVHQPSFTDKNRANSNSSKRISKFETVSFVCGTRCGSFGIHLNAFHVSVIKQKNEKKSRNGDTLGPV